MTVGGEAPFDKLGKGFDVDGDVFKALDTQMEGEGLLEGLEKNYSDRLDYLRLGTGTAEEYRARRHVVFGYIP